MEFSLVTNSVGLVLSADLILASSTLSFFITQFQLSLTLTLSQLLFFAHNHNTRKPRMMAQHQAGRTDQIWVASISFRNVAASLSTRCPSLLRLWPKTLISYWHCVTRYVKIRMLWDISYCFTTGKVRIRLDYQETQPRNGPQSFLLRSHLTSCLIPRSRGGAPLLPRLGFGKESVDCKGLSCRWARLLSTIQGSPEIPSPITNLGQIAS